MATLRRIGAGLQRVVTWGIVGTVIGATPALAEFPDHSVTLIVPWNAGGSTDQTARPLAKAAEQILGQPVVIVNKPGASTTIGMTELARSAPDGYTLLLCSVANAISATLYTKLNYDFVRDNTPVAAIT